MDKWTDETAEWYAEKYGEYPTNQLAIDALEIAPDATIVDIGCGTGSALRHASKKVLQGRLIGIDPVPRMVEIAKERLSHHPANGRIEIHQGAAESLPLDEHEADIVLAFDSFDHWEKKEEGLREVRRILRHGGRFVVVKDGGTPGSNESNLAFQRIVQQMGFAITAEHLLQEGDVSFAMWVCTAA